MKINYVLICCCFTLSHAIASAGEIARPSRDFVIIEEKPSPQRLPTPQPYPPVHAFTPKTLFAPPVTKKCVTPDVNRHLKSSPVKVFVDQQDQTITIVTPDRVQPLVDKVSTGGGRKIPNGKFKKPPYCACTPKIERRLIRAIKESDFDKTTCSPAEIRARSTVFAKYESHTFTDGRGRFVPMPKAIRINGGIFFHQVPSSYKELLGRDVSGDCVRLSSKTASFLMNQINKYGAIEVNISEPRRISRKEQQYCDAQTLAQVRQDLRSGRIPKAQATGSEDVFGGVDSFVSLLGRMAGFVGGPQVNRLPPRYCGT